MNGGDTLQDQYARNVAATLRNRSKLNSNHNLLPWYRELYLIQFAKFPGPGGVCILEIESGVSPLKQFLTRK
jgi:hypothetical protein